MRLCDTQETFKSIVSLKMDFITLSILFSVLGIKPKSTAPKAELFNFHMFCAINKATTRHKAYSL